MPGQTQKHSSFHGFILRSRPFGEGNTILTLLDKDNGRIELSSFGSGSEKSSRRSALLVSNLISGISSFRKEDFPPSIKEVRVEASFPGITSDFKKLSFLYLIFEITDQLALKDDLTDFFILVQNTLLQIENCAHFEKYVFFCLIKMLYVEGILPHTDSPGDFNAEITGSLKNGFQAGNGSLRFLQDILEQNEMAFLDCREISPSVVQNLLELIAVVMQRHSGKRLSSLDLLAVHYGQLR